jgi:multidrug efflux system membrane fusion protein
MRFWVVLFPLLLGGAACTRQQSAAPPPAPIPVVVATVEQKTIPVQLRAIGSVEAYTIVYLKSQVTGKIAGVHFRAGQDVSKGDLLFSIDRRPFEVALQEAEANLGRDRARAENARVQASRYAKLFQEGVAAREQYDQTRTEADALEAAVRADQAAVEKAKLDLEYCSILAPVGGRTGGVLVYPGNVVKANEDPALAVINQLNPIYVTFFIPEQYLPEVKRHMAAGPLKVEAIIPDSPGPAEEGALSFVDNAVDKTTGTIRLKATFANQEKQLWPGLFVDARLRLSAESNAIVVPSQAVQTGQGGQYVFVVKPDQTAESRPIVASRTYESWTVVEKGLSPGETVVTDGQLRLVPGAKVAARTSPQGG